MNGNSGMLLGIVLLFGVASVARADLFTDLTELKKICDAELLTEDECKERREAILAKYDSQENQNAWFCNYGGEPDAPQPIRDKIVIASPNPLLRLP